MIKPKCLTPYIAILLSLVLASPASAALYLLFNVGDNEDREVSAAGMTLQDARNGNRPAAIDSQAERYFVHLPGATMQTLDGAAHRVDPPVDSASTGAATASAASDSSMAATSDEGDTGWIEYEAAAATLMLFSPDGVDQESDVRFEPARVFLRRFADGSVFAMITSRDGDPPQ